MSTVVVPRDQGITPGQAGTGFAIFSLSPFSFGSSLSLCCLLIIILIIKFVLGR